MKKKLLFPLIIFIFGFFIINEVSTFFIGLEKAKKDSFQKNKSALDTLLKLEQNSLKSIAIMLSNDKRVKQAYINNQPEEIYEVFEDNWKKVKQEKLLHEVHFFKPPAISFANFSNHKSIGDDASDVRKDIKWVIKTFKSSTHFMMCKTYAGIRATYPILDFDGEILGGISLGNKMDLIPSRLKELTSNNSILIYNNKFTSSLLPKYYDEFMKDKVVAGNYVIAKNSKDIDFKNIKDIDFSKNIQDIVVNDKRYSLNILALEEFGGEDFGYILVLNDLKTFHSYFYTQMLKNLFVLFLITLIVYFVINYKLNLIIKQIEKLKELTNKFRDRDFTTIQEYTKNYKVINGELDSLNSNILNMGESLNSSYKALEEELVQKDILLKEQLKFVVMGEMLDNIAHQWRQPLSLISTSSSGLRVQKELDMLNDEELMKSLDKITQSAQYLSHTIDDFRYFLNDSKEKKYFKIEFIIEATLALVEAKFKNLDINIVKNIDDLELKGLDKELIQVIMNLINNSKDELEHLDKDRYIFIDVYEENSYVIILVKDSAGGVPENIIDKIFDQRFTTKEKNGTGIGLYMSKEIIEKSFNAKLSVCNKEYEYRGKKLCGAEFKISIPIEANN